MNVTARILGAVAIVAATSLATALGPGATYEIPWSTFDSGGTASGGPYVMRATIGQPDAGQMSGGGYVVSGGFEPGAPAGATCAGDVNGDGVVNVFDLLAVLDAWGPCPGCPADINGDGVVNVFDLLAVLDAWGPC